VGVRRKSDKGEKEKKLQERRKGLGVDGRRIGRQKKTKLDNNQGKKRGKNCNLKKRIKAGKTLMGPEEKQTHERGLGQPWGDKVESDDDEGERLRGREAQSEKMQSTQNIKNERSGKPSKRTKGKERAQKKTLRKHVRVGKHSKKSRNKTSGQNLKGTAH